MVIRTDATGLRDRFEGKGAPPMRKMIAAFVLAGVLATTQAAFADIPAAPPMADQDRQDHPQQVAAPAPAVERSAPLPRAPSNAPVGFGWG